MSRHPIRPFFSGSSLSPAHISASTCQSHRRLLELSKPVTTASLIDLQGALSWALESSTNKSLLVGVALIGVLLLFMGLFSRNKDLSGQHAFVTGGSKGIGLETAKELVRQGCDVTIVARGKAELDKAQGELRALAESLGKATKVVALSADVANAQDMAKAVTLAEVQIGPIDILIANAGSSIPGAGIHLDCSALRYPDVDFVMGACCSIVSHVSFSTASPPYAIEWLCPHATCTNCH